MQKSSSLNGYSGLEYPTGSSSVASSLLRTPLPIDISEESIESNFDSSYINSIQKHNLLLNLHNVLDNAHKECEEEGFDLFDNKARENARQILDSVCPKFPEYEYDIYPTEDREIAINCNPQKGRGIWILCDSEGGLAYFTIFDGMKSQFRCNSIQKFPYDSLWKAFEQFNRWENHYSSVNNNTSTLANSEKIKEINKLLTAV